MPLPLIFLAVSGAVAAASRGASWLSERKVKQTNADIQQVEWSANQKNEQYRSLRNHWKTVFEARLALIAEAYQRLLVSHRIDERVAETWSAEPWLLERMGELTVRRPLLVEPNFDQSTTQHQMNGFRMYQSGTNLARSSPGLGGAMQAGGFVVATGAYVTQQTNMIADAEKYIANAKVYMAALRAAIDGFDARFRSEVEDDCRSVDRIAGLLVELEAKHRPSDLASTKCLAVVYRTFIGFLNGLIGRYA